MIRKRNDIWGAFSLWGLLALWVISVEAQSDFQVYNIKLPALTVAEALTRLSEQTGVAVLFPYDIALRKRSNSIQGKYKLLQAVEVVLDGTGFSGRFSDKGVLVIAANKPSISKINKNREKQKMRVKKSLFSGLAALFTPLLVTPLTMAEEFEGKGALEEIIITAQKRTESLQDVPIAVSAFSGENLINYGATGTQALENITPGLVYNQSGPLMQPFLRGVGSRISVSGLEPSIATYVDNRYLFRSTALMFELADVERVEVLKGPQGTLYGRNATGGAIRIITKDVTDELEGSITGSFGNFNSRAFSGTVNVPITDAFGARFTVLNKQRDGFADNLVAEGVSELDDQDVEAYRAKFRWDVTDHVTTGLTLAYSTRQDTQGGDIVVVDPQEFNVGIFRGGITGNGPDEAATAQPGPDDTEEFSGEFDIKVAFDRYDFSAISTFEDFDQVGQADSDGSSATLLDAGIYENGKAFSQEFQLTSNGSQAWNWLVGVYYFDSDADLEVRLDAGLPVMISTSVQNVKTTATAIFGETNWNINERWSLTLGGRWSSEKKEVQDTASMSPRITVIPVPFEDSAKWDEFTPKVILEYQMENAMAYLTYARGFKSGGFNYPASGGTTLEPEILDMLEFGVKGDFLSDQLRLNASLFFYDYKDLQVSRATAEGGNASVTTENAANSEVVGFDIDITWLATNNLIVTGGLNILDTKYLDYDANAKVFNASLTGNPAIPGMADVAFDASGESLLRAPDWSAFVSFEYTLETKNGTLPVVLTYSYKDDYNFDFVADPLSKSLQQDGYGLLTSRVSYIPNNSHWKVALWGNNLTDEEYFNDIVANATGIRGSYGAPRTFGVDVTFDF